MPFPKIGSKSRNRSSNFVFSAAIACLISSQTLLAQEELDVTKPAAVLPEIKDNPAFVDGAQFMSKGLAQQATVNFEKSTLEEVVTWLSRQLKGQENPLNNSRYGTAPMAHGIMGGMGMGGGMGAAQSGTFGGGMF